MEKHSSALLISCGLLCLCGVQSAIGIPAAFVARDLGQFTRTAQISSGVGAIISMLLWFGLAYAQWVRRGSWGRGIAVFALIVLGLQSFLTYLAVSRGRVPLDASTVTNYVIFSLIELLALTISSFISYAEHRKRT